MLENLLAWLADWRHPAFLVAAVLALYVAREAVHRLLRASLSFAATALRQIDAWLRLGAASAARRHRRLAAALKEEELQPRLPGEVRHAAAALARIDRALPLVRDEAGLARVEQLERRARESTARLADHVEQHRRVIESYGVHLSDVQSDGQPATPPTGLRAGGLGSSSGTRLVFALVLVAAVGIAGWLNFALLERPMAEVVGDSYRVMGVPIYRLAALAIIVLEIAVGMVLLEALGGTTMFPPFERLEEKKALRITIVVTLGTALVVLALIEAALALTRDDITQLERELMGTLAGAGAPGGAPSAAGGEVGQLARWAQAAFGFIIPFALAFLGFAIEMLVRHARVVLQLVLAFLLQLLSFVVRLLHRLVTGLLAVLLALYDLLIFLPLFVERKLREARA